MQVDAGELRHRIQIFEKSKETDSDGYGVDQLTLVRSCMAKFSRQSGTEALRAGADMTDIKVRFLVRWSRIKIDRKMIVRYAGTDYEIQFVNDYEDKHEYLEIWCQLSTRAR